MYSLSLSIQSNSFNEVLDYIFLFQKMNLLHCLSWEQINLTKNLFLRCIRIRGAAAVTHLTFGSNAYVSVDRCVGPQVDGLLDADIS